MLSLFISRPLIQFYYPNAESVSLVVEGQTESMPMNKDSAGMWSLKLDFQAHILHGLAYHFEVCDKGKTRIVADPLAPRTERKEHGLVSYFSDLAYQWQHANFVPPMMRDLIIYESHLPALSRHKSAKVDHESHRGTYVGASSSAIVSHLKKLGVAVEFLPLHASDNLLGQDWGYFSTSFHAMRECFALDTSKVNREVMSLIDTLHSNGIPVLLDVVFNHGGELWVKAWGEDIVYRKHDNGDFCHGSGCGPTIQTEHPVMRDLIVDTLLHLVKDYRIDGFRFDLGALHDKKTILEIDSRLPEHIYLIAEPWALGGTQWGKGDMGGDFAATRWAVWNDDFRESGRTFLMGKGDHHNRDRLMCAIKGTHYKDFGWTVRPQQSINYLSSHDGKTLTDFVNGDKKRVFLGILLVLTSQGVPMLGEGTELMYSKMGEENTYNRPDLNQIDWNNANLHADLVDATAELVTIRKTHMHFRYSRHLKQRNVHKGSWDMDWIYPTGHPHHDNVNAIGYVIRPPAKIFHWRFGRQRLIVLLNGSKSGVDFHLPKGKWKVLVDGDQIKANTNGIPGALHAQGSYHTHAGTGVVLAPV